MKKIIFLLLLVLNFAMVSASPIELLETHYTAFANENWSSYINTFIKLDEAQIKIKKENVEKQWKMLDTLAFELSDFKFQYYEDLIVVTYTADFTIQFSDDKKAIEDQKRFSALIIGDKIGFIGDELNVKKALSEIFLEMENVTIYEQKEVNTCGDGRCEINESCEVDCRVLTYKCIDCEKISVEDIKDELPKTKKICDFDKTLLNSQNKEISKDILNKIPDFLKEKILGEVALNILIDDVSYPLLIKDGIVNAKPLKKFDYVVNTTSCTLKNLQEKEIDFNTAYDQDLITIKGTTIGPKFKTFILSIGLTIKSWFNPQPKEILIEAESGKLYNKGRWSNIGIASSRGVEELYLGTGGSYAEYEFKSPFKGEDVELWIKVSDDGLHKDGSRSVEILFNDKLLNYNHKSVDYYSSGEIWGWEKVGLVEVNKKNNRVIFKKPKQTSAAFVMDKFKLIKK